MKIWDSPGLPESRPTNCRNRLRDSGQPYPKSGCQHCKTGGMTGCPYEGGAASGNPPPPAPTVPFKPDPTAKDWGQDVAWEIVRERKNALHDRRSPVVYRVHELREQVQRLRTQTGALYDSAVALEAADLPHASVISQARDKETELNDALQSLNTLEHEWTLLNKCLEWLESIHDGFFCLLPEEQRLGRHDSEFKK